MAERQAFIEQNTPAELDHTRQFSFDPADMSGNIENLFGVAQVPIGLAGPLLVNGEHAQGEVYVPMATIEGTMLASYNRGMRVIRESGGVTTTVSGEAMQRLGINGAYCPGRMFAKMYLMQGINNGGYRSRPADPGPAVLTFSGTIIASPEVDDIREGFRRSRRKILKMDFTPNHID